MTAAKRRSSSKAASARQHAVEHLNRVDVGGAYVALVGDEPSEELDPREERQATEYVAGITRWRGWLDFLVQHYYEGKFNKMEPALRQVLRVGLYDLLFLHTPPHAALNEAVELAKRNVRPGAGRLVNGILRRVLRERDALPVPDTGNPAKDLAIRFSHPSWLVRRWLGRLGSEETEALLRWNNTRPVFGVRINTRKTPVDAFKASLGEQGTDWEASPYLDDFIRMPRLQPLLRGGWLEKGYAAVQDESGGLVVRLLDPQPGETLIDTCAAPGGKALYAAALMQDKGRLFAYDVHPGRLHLVRQAAAAQGVTMLQPEIHDLRDFILREDRPAADRVLLDAPCSGLGVLAKRADLRWNRTPEEMVALTALQDQLLDAAALLVKPGGLLVYSTCTIEPEENEERVEAFLQRHPHYHLETAEGYVPAAVVTAEGYLATLPYRHHVDGAFGARLRRG